MALFVEFIKGPMVWISSAVFLGGLLVQVWRFFAITRKKKPLYQPAAAKPKEKKPAKKTKQKVPSGDKLTIEAINRRLQPLIRITDKQWNNLENTIFRTHPIVALVTVVFHLLLFIIPLFLLAHNELIRGALGFSLPSLSERLADTMTVVLLMCGSFFLLRRIFVRRVRAITTAWDYFILLITLTPFFTGFLAFHQWGDYPTVMLIHILSAELVLILIPFTKLNHMVYFFLYRLLIGSEYSFGQGKRVW
ncbi:MAG: hypothetical protein JXA30_17825 [Deltaproteobacteria bacterium]|nr:hypothetical protein [Deltaproteobacteria bacterium]